ncbi:DUF3179 domain-containing (seleno)protein [Hwangdonia lutea]|uniref:DUF3179 domain-containing (Seleno)protein n=1 Tax=Hwangdonia lutea TaxID=3075823 RepID=A0AA97EIS5_9FLAO|nr:DUF3179 domain-containing (seleno)protein [Hwangdonia sp. SCSIO 19198]WOD42221.1 DUF3179 domain-containing (seleno)protein [Hwangdonia sp. SCSIO 19198]
MKRVFILLSVGLIFISCSTNNKNINDLEEEVSENLWCVPESTISDGTSFFPLMDNPNYTTVSEIETRNFLNDNSKLALYKINNQVYAYPYDYTNKYEVINDSFDDTHIALTYCPFTESALCFDRKLSNDNILTLKASGYLHKDNLVPSDANTTLFWSQMKTSGLRLNNKEDKLKTFNILETRWQTVKNHYPNALVFNFETNCETCAGAETQLNLNNLFGVINEHVLEDTIHLFKYEDFSNNTKIVRISVNNKNTIVVGNKNKVYFNAFYIPSNITFSALDDSEFPLVLKDNEGNKWDIFGVATEGPRTGSKLTAPKSYVAAGWAWEDFFENLIYYNN